MNLNIILLLLMMAISQSLFSQDSLRQKAISETFISFISKQDSIASLEDLKSNLDNILKDNRISKSKFGISIYSLDRNEFIYQINQDKPLIPASLTKLFTSFNSLTNYGTEFKLNTNLYVDSINPQSKEIYGNLYLKGAGDPAFSFNDLDTLFVYLKNNNISVLNGNLIIDLSLFDKVTSRFKYSGDKDKVENVNAITPFVISTRAGTKLKNYIKKFFRKKKIRFNGSIKFSFNDIDYLKLNHIGTKSRSIIDIIYTTNKRSNNYFAEHLFKLNSLINKDEQSDFRNSQKRMYEIIDSLNINFDNCELNDGSGLSRRNKLTPNSIISLLKIAFHSEFKDEFRASLSHAGEDGTLRGRLIGTHGEKNINGKTGTLRNASGLSGYLKTVDGENIAFVIMFNGNKRKTYKYIENELADAISGFFYFNEKYE